MISVSFLSKAVDAVVLCPGGPGEGADVCVLPAGKGHREIGDLFPRRVCDLLGLIRHVFGVPIPSLPNRSRDT